MRNPGAWPRGWSTRAGFGRGADDVAAPGTRAQREYGSVTPSQHTSRGTTAENDVPASLTRRADSDFASRTNGASARSGRQLRSKWTWSTRIAWASTWT